MRLASVATVLALGCSAPATRDAVWERNADAMAGRWNVRFAYATGESATGELELTVNRAVDAEYPGMGLPTNYGSYAVDFVRLGGSPAGKRVPAIVAGVVRDSLRVSFETDREGFSMQMRGALGADSIRGAWSATQARGTIAAGTFLLTRR